MYAICTFQGSTSSQLHQNQNMGSPTSKHSKKNNQIQTNRNGQPNLTTGISAKFNTLQGISGFQNLNECSKTSVKHCLVNFMPDKTEKWAGEYPRELLVYQQRYRQCRTYLDKVHTLSRETIFQQFYRCLCLITKCISYPILFKHKQPESFYKHFKNCCL